MNSSKALTKMHYICMNIFLNDHINSDNHSIHKKVIIASKQTIFEERNRILFTFEFLYFSYCEEILKRIRKSPFIDLSEINM